MQYVLVTVLFFLFGAESIAAQVYFIRELLVVFFGNEICIGIIFALWFAGIGTGAVFGERLARSRNRTALFIGTAALFAVLPCMVVPVIRSLRGLLDLSSGSFPNFYQICTGTSISIFPFSFLVGILFPLACRSVSVRQAQASLSISRIYVWEALGSLAGGLIVSLVLIPAWRPLTVFGFLAAAQHLVCAFMLFGCLQIRYRKGAACAFLLLFFVEAYAASCGALTRLDDFFTGMRWRTLHNRMHRVESRDTRYQHLTLAEEKGQYTMFSNGTLLFSYPDSSAAAVKAHLFLCQHPAPRRVLVLGTAEPDLLLELLKHPLDSLECVELDPAIFQMMRSFLREPDIRLLDDGRLAFHFIDSRRFVQQCRRRFDVVIVNAPDPSTAMLNRLYTIDFFFEARQLLNDDGILITGMSSTANYISSESAVYNASLYRSLQAVFEDVLPVPGDENRFFAAPRSGVLTRSSETLAHRYAERGITSMHFAPQLFRWLMQQERIKFLLHEIEDAGTVPANTDIRPVTYYYNLVLWNILTEGKNRLPFPGTGDRAGALLFFTAVTLLTAVLAWAVSRGTRFGTSFDISWVLFTTGYSGLSLEIVIIYLIQSRFGYVYEKIGIIAALFMAGLAAGGFLVRRYLQHEQVSVRRLAGVEFFLAAVCGSVLIVADSPAAVQVWATTEYVYAFLLFCTGLAVGMEFPLGCGLLLQRGSTIETTAARMDAADHFGACIGAAVTGTLCVALFGLFATCLFLCFLKAAGLLLLLSFCLKKSCKV